MITPKSKSSSKCYLSLYHTQRRKKKRGDSLHVPHPFAFQIFPLCVQINATFHLILILHSHSLIPPSSSSKTIQYKTYILAFSNLSNSLMIPELERPRVTEVKVRMDCNGCVQKIKKALHGINGIYDLYIDFPQQKLTIIGWADPEKIVKAIRKTRKIATICSHTEQPDPNNQPTEQTPEGGAPPPADGENPPPPEGPPDEAPQPGEPPIDPPPPENPTPHENPPPPENPATPEVKPSPIAADTNANQQAGPSGSKDIGEVHIIHHHPPDYSYGYGYPPQSYPGHWNRCPSGQVIHHEAPQPQPQSYPGHWNRYPSEQVIQHEAPQPRPQPQPQPQPIYVSHSYNTYKPSPYVTEYEYVRSPPRYTNYSRMDHYSEDYQNSNVYYNNSYGNGNGNGNITSMFSDENPNACRIM